MKTTRLLFVCVAGLAVIGTASWQAYSHCQIPCGIYDDGARLAAVAEHIKTIEKSMRLIDELGSAKKPNHNQIVRWVNNKEHHADAIGEIVTGYFMAQRIKPADATDAKAHAAYVKKLTLLHRMLVAAMKAKQTTDLKYTKELSSLLDEFTHAYSPKAHKH